MSNHPQVSQPPIDFYTPGNVLINVPTPIYKASTPLSVMLIQILRSANQIEKVKMFISFYWNI